MRTKYVGVVLASTAAALFASASFAADNAANYGNNAAGFSSAAADNVKCLGLNSCKGQGACKTANNACKGQNTCKGKGATMEKSADACTKAGGTVDTTA